MKTTLQKAVAWMLKGSIIKSPEYFVLFAICLLSFGTQLACVAYLIYLGWTASYTLGLMALKLVVFVTSRAMPRVYVGIRKILHEQNVLGCPWEKA